MLFGECDRHCRQQRVVDFPRIDIRDDGQALLVSQRVKHLVRIQEAFFDDHIGESLVALGLT